MVYELRKVDVTTVNERVAELKAQALVNTGRHTSTNQDWYDCLQTAEVEAKKFFDIQAQRLAAAKVAKLAWTLDEVNAKSLVF